MVTELIPLARTTLDQFELILVNDGSTDQTGPLIDSLAASMQEVMAIHHPSPQGVNQSFLEALDQAHFPYMTLLPGDHAYNTEGLRHMFEAVGTVDLVISYRTNQVETRTKMRVFLSLLYGKIINLLFGNNIRDYHSAVVYPVAITRQIPVESKGYLYGMEMLVKLLRRGVTYVEVPVVLNVDTAPGKSRSLRWKTLVNLLSTLWLLTKSRNESTSLKVARPASVPSLKGK